MEDKVDLLGNKLNIGDRVVFNDERGPRLFVGTIVKFTKRTVKIEYPASWSATGHIITTGKEPQNVVKV